ncbi:MAG TPA: DsrE family protein [Chthonomonadaceae bacterium]|nr:DsrE family protein [Chthonomonadaceae bacterium]
MKRFTPVAILFLALIVGLLSLHATSVAQEKKARMHHIVFEVNGEGKDPWQAVLNNVENLQKALGRENTQIEVVAHGNGLGLLVAAGTPYAERLKQISDSGVVFAACENTMRRKNVKREDLLPFATTVPSGITEVVLKQEAGWSYIKGGF